MSKKTKEESAVVVEKQAVEQSTTRIEEQPNAQDMGQSTIQVEEQPNEELIDKDFDKLAEGLFKTVIADELYFTADGIAFFSALDAKNHAVGLDDNKVVAVKRK